MKKLFLLFVLVFGVSITQAAPVKELYWAGCGITKKAFMKSLAQADEKQTGIKIHLSGGGATKGIRQVAKLQKDIGGSCRFKLEPNEEEKVAEMHPVAWDALVVIVNKDNPVKGISMEQLRQVYLGKITNWKELGGEDQPIDLMIRKGKISGVGYTLRRLVFVNADIEFKSSHVFPSTGPLEKAIVANKNAIGVTGISSARKRDVKMLALGGKMPTYENIKKGRYELYRPLYLVSNINNPNNREVLKFIRFAQSKKGRDIIRKNKVVPYFDALNLLAKQIQQDLQAYKKGY